MKLYLMRHGHSPSAAEAGVPTDAERPLSPRGRQAVRKMAEALAHSGAKPGLLLHSPWRRADESSRELAEILRIERRALEALANAVPAETLYEQLTPALTATGELVAVGHQPLLGELVAWLSGQVVDLRPAGMVALDIPGGKGRPSLLWSRNVDEL